MNSTNFGLHNQKERINTTLETIYSGKQTVFNLFESQNSQPKTYSIKMPFSHKNLEEQWAEIVKWFLEESETRSTDLLIQLKGFLTKYHEVRPTQPHTLYLQKWINSLEQLAHYRYHLGSSLNKFYHFNNFSFVHRVGIINCLREFIEWYSKALESQGQAD